MKLLESYEKVMGWFTAWCKMLLFHVKLLSESHTF